MGNQDYKGTALSDSSFINFFTCHLATTSTFDKMYFYMNLWSELDFFVCCTGIAKPQVQFKHWILRCRRSRIPLEFYVMHAETTVPHAGNVIILLK